MTDQLTLPRRRTAPAMSPRLIARARAISAAAGRWVESAALEGLCEELARAVVGRPMAPGSRTPVLHQPTEDTAASFENGVFALRAFCWCGGAVHGRDRQGVAACPPNFEFFEQGASVLRGEWFRALGPGTVFTSRPSPQEITRIRAVCLASLRV